MTDARKPKARKTGEKAPGKFHYNPVNMAGRKADTARERDEPNQQVAEPARDGESDPGGQRDALKPKQ